MRGAAIFDAKALWSTAIVRIARFAAVVVTSSLVWACGLNGSSGDAERKVAQRAAPGGELRRLSQRVEVSGQDALGSGVGMTPEETAAVAHQLEQCWGAAREPSGQSDATVHLKLRMNRDGTIRRLEFLDRDRLVADAAFRGLAESVVKALFGCMPLNLPPDGYSVWETLLLKFVAKGAV